MGGKIPVTVVSGFLGSGKTTLLNRILSDARRAGGAQAAARTVVLINELGDIGLDHERVMQLDGRVVLLESGCLCCAVRGDLVDALRRLFLDALNKRIPPFSALLMETTGIADPAPVMYTLQYERFLADRYAYSGCITVVDGQHGLRQLREHPEAAQQAVLADVLAVSKADLAAADDVAALKDELERLNPAAPQYSMQSLPEPAALLRLAARRREGVPGGARLWSGPAAGSRRPAHSGVGVLTMRWARPWVRSMAMRALSDLLADMGSALLRLKGRVRFQGEPQASALHAVHQHLYPVQAIVAPPAAPHPAAPEEEQAAAPDGGAAVLVLIYRGLDEEALLRRVQALLPGGIRVLSSDGNFIQ